MENKEVKKATLESLMGRKGLIKTMSEIEYFSKKLGESLIFVKIDLAKVQDYLVMMSQGSISVYDAMVQIIYYSCPLLQNKELQQYYEVVEPFDIVSKLLCNLVEINNAFDKIMFEFGYVDRDSIEKIKKQ